MRARAYASARYSRRATEPSEAVWTERLEMQTQDAKKKNTKTNADRAATHRSSLSVSSREMVMLVVVSASDTRWSLNVTGPTVNVSPAGRSVVSAT
jgi:hypothetical protein